jgi:hypothetical protein
MTRQFLSTARRSGKSLAAKATFEAILKINKVVTLGTLDADSKIMFKTHEDTGYDPITDFLITNIICAVFGSLAGFAFAVMYF